MNPILLTDAYKISHPKQYPAGTEYVYSNITARKSRIEGVDEIVVFGIQYFIRKYLIEEFNTGFFRRPKEEVIAELDEFFASYFGPGAVDTSIYAELHDLGYLPLVIKALPEGTLCPVGVPFMTIQNTHPKFFWLTNFIETLSQTVLWNMITSATIANRFRVLLDRYAEETGADPEFVKFQGHNFSMRGMSSPESGITADLGHLLSFCGSDTLPGLWAARKYYDADPTSLISCSVPATEHAVMCAGGKNTEKETFRRLIQDIYPSGIVSIVSDTWNLWDVCTVILPELKDIILARDGKVVIRPDSGDPVKIVAGYTVVDCGVDPEDKAAIDRHLRKHQCDCIRTTDGRYFTHGAKELSLNEVKGVVQLLWETFGGATNAKGFKELNPKIGVIYGDSITYPICEAICKQLKDKGFASSNMVFGIGSYTYQYNTRDTFSIACKATWCQINGEGIPMSKDPVTDSGTKKSAHGLLRVAIDPYTSRCVLEENVDREREKSGMLELVHDGAYYAADLGYCFEEIQHELKWWRNRRKNG